MKKKETSTKELIGIKNITDYSIISRDDMVFFIIQPINLSMLSEESIRAKVYSLMTVLKGLSEIEILCLNSRENFDANKSYLKSRMDQENNEILREMIIRDLNFLDRIQIQMATAREFYMVIRLKNENEKEIFPYLSRIEKILVEQGFLSKRADKEDMKKMLSVYFEQNVTTDKFEDYDGERWVILNEQ